MLDYQKFKASAIRHKYEAALEYKRSRLLYGELLDRVNTVYNSLCQMTARGTLLLLTRDTEISLCVSLAASRAGLRCVHADSKISVGRAKELSLRFKPDTVVLPAIELSRIGPVFVNDGCKFAVVTDGRPDFSVFPSEFCYDDFLKMNDYSVSRPDGETCPEQIYADGVCLFKTSFDDIALRDGIYVDFPAYSPECAAVLDSIVLSGHKCVLPDDLSQKTFKKQRVSVAVTKTPRKFHTFLVDTVLLETDTTYVYGGVFDADYLGREFSKAVGRDVSLSFEKDKIVVSVTLEITDDTTDIAGSALAKTLKSAASDLLYAFDCPKTFVFRQKQID